MPLKSKIYYIDRASGKKQQEQVYGDALLNLLYSKSFIGKTLAFLSARISLFSKLYAFLQTLPRSKKKIRPFIEKYHINEQEFLLPTEKFRSFDDFFTRKLKPGARPIEKKEHVAVIPADGRFLFYPQIDTCDGFVIKGKKFSLSQLLRDEKKAKRYATGSLVLGRLCPIDYHRFHFPCHCLPGPSYLIHGPLYSVNPIAVRQNLSFLAENKRMVTELKTDSFGTILYLEIGATNVGSIHQTYTPNTPCEKGDEKGYFSFGGSALVLLFEPGSIQFDRELVLASFQHIETLCAFGQSMGSFIKHR